MNETFPSDDLDLAPSDIDALWRNINRSPSDPVAYWISMASFTFALLGSISNLMSVVVLIRLSTQLSTFVYLTGLSLSDMITCLSIMSSHTVEFLAQKARNVSVIVFLRYVEIVCGGLAAGSRVLSLWISTAVTMDRWILICYPIYGKTFCTLKRARIMSLTLFFIAFLYSVPLFFEFEIIQMPSVYPLIHSENDSDSIFSPSFQDSPAFVTKGYSDLAKRRLFRWAYMFFNAIFVYTLPTLMIVFFNIQLIRALHRLKSRTKRLRQKNGTTTNGTDTSRQRHSSRRSQQSKYSVTIMVITMVLTLLLCRSPTIVIWVLWSFELTIKTFFDSSSSSMARRFHNIANLIAIINAATNFLPFCVFGQLFRAECLNIYCCRKVTSEQLAQQARRKHDETQQGIPKNPRPAAIVRLQNSPSMHRANSEATSGLHSSQNPLPIVGNRPMDLSVNPEMIHLRSSSTTVPLLAETMGL